MLKRVITGTVAFFILLPILFLSDTIVFPIAVAVVLAICIYEMARCMGFERKIYITLPIYIFAIVSPFIIRYGLINFIPIAFAFVSFYLVYLFALIVWSKGALSFGETMGLFSTLSYIIAAILSIMYVRFFADNGKYLYLLIFIGAWVTDIFAYFTGYLFGKHKLIEEVSPKKTIEGSIGGIVFCSLGFVLFGLAVEKFFEADANILFLVISGIIISIVSQIGDLIMSVIKRHYKIKDYGKIFPGHGGMLDRFDSINLVALVLAAICMIGDLIGTSLL